MADNNNCFFEVVPEDYSEVTVNDAPSEELATFIDKARDDGFGETAIERAVSLCKGKCNSYEEFCDFIDKGITAIDEEQLKERIRRENIRKSVAIELKKLEDKDVIDLINKSIYANYNTTAVTALELVDECSKTFNEESEELYGECKYAVYLCMKSDWVKRGLAACLDRWDTSMEVKRYITSYLKTVNVDPDNYNAGIRQLVDYLPEAIKNENSPTLYKSFRAVQIITSKAFTEPADFDTQVRESSTYYDVLLDCREKNMPLLAAEQLATSIASKKGNLVENAGLLVGKAVTVKYKFASSIDEAIRESLGDKADDYYAQREQKKQAKEQQQIERDLRKSNERAADIKAQVRVSEPKPRKPEQHVQQRQQRPKQSQKRVEHKDFNPYVPTWLMFTIGGVLISLLMLIWGKFMFVIMLLSTSCASYGWYCQSHGKTVSGKSPVLCIVGGYVCAVMLLMFKIM